MLQQLQNTETLLARIWQRARIWRVKNCEPTNKDGWTAQQKYSGSAGKYSFGESNGEVVMEMMIDTAIMTTSNGHDWRSEHMKAFLHFLQRTQGCFWQNTEPSNWVSFHIPLQDCSSVLHWNTESSDDHCSPCRVWHWQGTRYFLLQTQLLYISKLKVKHSNCIDCLKKNNTSAPE